MTSPHNETIICMYEIKAVQCCCLLLLNFIQASFVLYENIHQAVSVQKISGFVTTNDFNILCKIMCNEFFIPNTTTLLNGIVLFIQSIEEKKRSNVELRLLRSFIYTFLSYFLKKL